MKKNLLLLSFMLMAFCVNAQNMVGKASFAIPGGENGKNYAIWLQTSKGKADLVSQTIEILDKYQIADRSECDIDEVDESTTDLKVPICYRDPVQAGSGIMGMKYTLCPIKLGMSLRFVFQEEGKALIVFENMEPELFIVPNCQFGSNATKSEMEEEYTAHTVTIVAGNSFIMKALVWANKGIEGLKDYRENLDKFFDDIDSMFKLYERIEQAGDGEWMTPEQYLKLVSKSDINCPKSVVNGIEKFVNSGSMIAVPQDRWEKHVRQSLNNIFTLVATTLDGQIIEVGEDGETTWTMEGDKLLPNDPKLRKKYQKKGLDFYNQE